jgi:hypothetical protein
MKTRGRARNRFDSAFDDTDASQQTKYRFDECECDDARGIAAKILESSLHLLICFNVI